MVVLPWADKAVASQGGLLSGPTPLPARPPIVQATAAALGECRQYQGLPLPRPAGVLVEPFGVSLPTDAVPSRAVSAGGRVPFVASGLWAGFCSPRGHSFSRCRGCSFPCRLSQVIRLERLLVALRVIHLARKGVSGEGVVVRVIVHGAKELSTLPLRNRFSATTL